MFDASATSLPIVLSFLVLDLFYNLHINHLKIYSIDCHIKKDNHLINKYLSSQIKFETLSWLIYDFLEKYLEVSDIHFKHMILSMFKVSGRFDDIREPTIRNKARNKIQKLKKKNTNFEIKIGKLVHFMLI